MPLSQQGPITGYFPWLKNSALRVEHHDDRVADADLSVVDPAVVADDTGDLLGTLPDADAAAYVARTLYDSAPTFQAVVTLHAPAGQMGP